MSEVSGGELEGRTERVVTHFSDFLTVTLRRITSLAFGVATTAVVIGAATYATGLWAFDSSRRSVWIVLGAVICGLPAAAGLVAWLLVRTTARRAPGLAGDVRNLLQRSNDNMAMVIDHDSGQPLATTARSLGSLRTSLAAMGGSFPALSAAVRAVTRVPGLVAVAVLGALAVGALGTIVMIGHLIG